MKKLLFAAVNMEVGGIETALLTLLNYLASSQNEITLVLEEAKGIFLKELDKKIKIIEYKPDNSKNVLIRKTKNLIKRIKFILKYKNKFDFSASFATYSNMASFIARTASKNNALWGHADYLELFHNNTKEVKKFFDTLQVYKFKKIIFVSKKACKSFEKVYPEMKSKIIYCNNLINYKKILEMSNEKVNYTKEDTYTFVNIGRHDEVQKKLTRIIESAKKLKEDNINFKILFIGDGKNTNQYKELVKTYKLEKQIQFLGKNKNPYPYMKLADSIILSSDYEGYPVVFLEALVLEKPIITTNVSDAMEDINNKYGQVIQKDEKELYKVMKKFIQEGYKIEEKFNKEEYNKKIINTLQKIINE